jgi:hypothetical protein
MSGKIDTIFFAVERILSIIEAIQETALTQDGGSLRQEILGTTRNLASPAAMTATCVVLARDASA